MKRSGNDFSALEDVRRQLEMSKAEDIGLRCPELEKKLIHFSGVANFLYALRRALHTADCSVSDAYLFTMLKHACSEVLREGLVVALTRSSNV
jgi:hypothetical protein